MGGASLNWKFCWVPPPRDICLNAVWQHSLYRPLWAKILDFLWTPKVRLKSAISTHKRGKEHLRSFHVGVFPGMQIVAVDDALLQSIKFVLIMSL